VRVGEVSTASPQKMCQSTSSGSDIIDFRNLLVHEYFRVDLKLIWQIVEQELPILKQQINSILQQQ
jgi:uncharacterized protein with HEPN domain